jgi:hypothetical protein
MPIADPSVPWDTIRAAYLSQAVPKSVIASKFGVKEDTLRKRIIREGWDTAKAHSLQVMGTVIIKGSDKAEKPKSVALREAVADELETDLYAVKQVKPRSLAAASKRQQVISSIVSNAKVVHGWGEQTQSTMINLGMLSGDTMPAIATEPEVQQQVIDVAPEPVKVSNPEST